MHEQHFRVTIWDHHDQPISGEWFTKFEYVINYLDAKRDLQFTSITIGVYPGSPDANSAQLYSES